MTNHIFKPHQSNIINLGTAGGRTKPSSGYTFQFIQKHSDLLLSYLLHNEEGWIVPPVASKFQFYDSVLLNVLATEKMQGAKIFTAMFKKNPPERIFRFLDNESSLIEDLKLIASLPTWPFLKAGVQEVLG